MSHEANNTRVVVAALIGNGLIALLKFVAAFLSGSVATLAEAVHSVADSANQVLLMVGMRRAEKHPTYLHPFGHAAESYFWPFMVSILIFMLGGAFAFYEGVHDLHDLLYGAPRHGHGSRLWSYLVLGGSLFFEAYSFSIAFSEFRKMRSGRGIWDTFVHAKDPTIPVVMLEDTAALMGLTVALISVALSDITGWAGFDAMGSIVIGCGLAVIAYFLAKRTHSLLLGEAASDEDQFRVRALAESVAGVEKVTQMLSMHIGPTQVILALKIRFSRTFSVADVEETIDRLEARVRAEMPHMRYMFCEPDGKYDPAQDPEQPWMESRLSQVPTEETEAPSANKTPSGVPTKLERPIASLRPRTPSRDDN